jgi:copper chaperone CopZ
MSEHHTQVVSSTPGRTRFRVSSEHRNQEEMERIVENLQAPPFVDSVEYNNKTGSILVHHDTSKEALQAIKDIMQNLGMMLQAPVR